MKYHLKEDVCVPYGGKFVVTDPQTGIELVGTTFNMVLRRLHESRRANGVPIGLGVEQELESWICAKYPHECEPFDARLPKSRRFGLQDILHGTIAMVAHRLSGATLVPDEEANRRADICSRCPLNVNVTMPCGGTCDSLKDLVKRIIGAKTTRQDGALKGCAVCGCWNAAQVWVPYETLDKASNNDMREQFKAANEAYGCWKVPQV